MHRTGTLRIGDGMLRFCLPLAPGLALLMLLAACQPEAGPATDTPLPRYLDQRAADGDTLVIGGERLRLAAIDAPELGQACGDAAGRAWACGRWAREYLAGLLAGPASCHGTVRDRYGRRVVHCSVAGQDLGAAMVAAGAARAYLRYGQDYAGAERMARAAKRGIWAGSFVDPEKVRHSRRR